MPPKPSADDRTSSSKTLSQLSALAPAQRQDFVNSTAASWIKDALSSSIGSFPSSYADTMAATNRQLEELRNDILEETYLSNPQPSEEYCKTLAVKLQKSFEEILFWFDQRRHNDPSQNVRSYKRDLKERYDYIDVIDLEVDSEAESVSSSCSSIRITGITPSFVKTEENSTANGIGSIGNYAHSPIKVEVKSEPAASPASSATAIHAAPSANSSSHMTNPIQANMQYQQTLDAYVAERSKADAPPRKTSAPPKVNTQLNFNSGNKEPSLASPTVDSQYSASSINTPDLPVELPPLMDKLRPLLGANDRIQDASSIAKFFRIMATRKEDKDKKQLMIVLDRSKTTEILNAIANHVDALKVLRVWVVDAIKRKKSFLLDILKFIQLLSVPKELLKDKDVKIGVAIQKVISDGDTSTEAKAIAQNIKEVWLKTSSSSTPVSATNEPRKRARSNESSPSTPAPPSKPSSGSTPGGLTIKKKTIRSPLLATTIVPDKKMVTAVSSFEIFNQMKPGASVTKIKKVDKVVAKRPTVDFDVNMEMNTGSSRVGGDTTSEFSYRRSSTDADNKRAAENDIGEKTQKKRKRVHFKSDDALCEIRYFDKDAEDTGEHHMYHRNAREMEFSEGDAFKLHPKDKVEAAKPWTPPTPTQYDDEISSLTWSKDSTEIATQEERERTSISAIYFRSEDIPDSPAEPAPEDPQSSIGHEVKHIPCEQFYTQNPNVVSGHATLTPQQPGGMMGGYLPADMMTGRLLPTFSAPTSIPSFTPPIQPTFQRVNQWPQTFVNQPVYTPTPTFNSQTYPVQSGYPSRNNSYQSRNFKKTQPCPFLMKGHCNRQDDCHYSHNL